LTFDPLIPFIFITHGNLVNRHFNPFINIKQFLGHSSSFAVASLPIKEFVCQ
jgi:hypothetical protein